MSRDARSYHVHLYPRARQFYESAGAEVQAKLERIFDRLEDNPYPDGDHKFYYTRYLPAAMTAYADDDFHIVYQLVSRDSPAWEQWRVDIITIAEARPLDFGADD